MHGVGGVKAAINEMVAMNEMSEFEFAHATSPGLNIGFAMWQAQIKPRHK